MNSTLITVIVPVYNVSAYLEKCVSSIVHQSYQELEILLVDDGSTDDSGTLCDQWTKKDPRIRVIHKQNGGLSDARNAGIDQAHGTYLMFVDSDDLIAADAVETMYRAAEAHHCEIAVCNMIRLYEEGRTENFYVPVQTETVWRENERFETLKQPSACNKLFLAALFRDLRFPKGKFYEDTFVYHKLLLQASAVVLTGRAGYYYLLREGSILGRPKYTDRYFDMIEAVYTRVVDLTKAQIPYYAEEACLSLYAAVSDGERHLKKTADNRDRVKNMRTQYRYAYEQLIHRKTIGLKQKIRLVILRFAPALHSILY